MSEKSIHEACAESAKLVAQHETLARFAGNWRAEVKFWMNPAGPPHVSTGTMVNRLVLGGRFIEHDYRDEAGMFEGKGFWGYNSIDGRFEGVWIDSMATFLQIEHGQHDAASDVFTNRGTMTDPSTRKPLNKRSVIRVKNPNEHVMEMYFETPMGEFKCMEITYRRA